MPISWNIPLVLLSVLIAIIGSFVALDHAERMRETGGRLAVLRAITGSITLGMTIWAMHFLSVLAFHLPIPVSYDLTLTLLSIVPAIATALLGFWALCCKTLVSSKRIAISGVLMGLGISVMHYTGMAALNMSPPLSYDPMLSTLSVITAIIAALSALLLMYQGPHLKLPPLPRLMLGALVMGGAISGMHYLAMLGTHVQPHSICLVGSLQAEPEMLALFITSTLLFLYIGSFLLNLSDHRKARLEGAVLAALVLAFSLMITYLLWQSARQQSEQLKQAEFDAHVHSINSSVIKRIKSYEQIMRGVDGLFSHSDTRVSRSEFHDHIAKLRLKEDYPGIQGLRFAPFVTAATRQRYLEEMRKNRAPVSLIWPDGQRDAYAPVTYIEPFDPRNQEVFGYDMLSDRDHLRPGDQAPGMRRAALEQAADSGEITLSGKIRMLFEPEQDAQHGVVMVLPVYKRGIYHSVAEQRTHLLGWAVAVLHMNDLITGIFDQRDTGFDIRIFDGTTTSVDTLLYPSDRNGTARHAEARFQHENPVEIANRIWTVRVRSTPAFDAMAFRRPTILAASGIAFSILLALLTLFLMYARANALQAAAAGRKSEILLRTASDGIFILDLSGNVVQMNDALCRMLGYPCSELQTMNVTRWDAQWSLQEMEVLEQLKQLKQLENAGPVFETRYLRQDGSSFDVEVSTARLEIDGQPLLYNSVRDITERKRTQGILHSIAATVATNVGEDFFREATHSLSELLDADCVILGEISEDGGSVRVLAMQLDGKPVQHYAYALPGTPCNVVTHDGYCEYPENIQQLFPTDADLVKLGAQAYVGSPIHDQHGKPNGILCAIFRHKLTPQPLRKEMLEIIAARAGAEVERQQAVQALRASEERWSFALEGAGDGVWDWDMQSDTWQFSPRYLDMLGYGENGIEPGFAGWSKLIHPEDLPGVQTSLQQYLDGGQLHYTVEFRMRCKDGSWKWVLCRGMVVERATDGKPARLTGTNSDISERIQSQEKVLKLSKAVENSPASVVITDQDGTIEYVNPEFTRVTGYTVQEAIGQNPRILQSGKLPSGFYRKMWQTILTGKTWHGEFKNKKKNGELYFESASITSIRNEAGHITHFVAVKKDITEHKRKERELKRSQAEADVANRSKSIFLANMSHEIRTPMNAILGFSHLCLQTELAPEQRDYLTKVHQSANALLNLINDILDFSKVEAGKLEIEKVPFQLDSVLNNVANISNTRADEKGLELSFHSDPDIPPVLIGDSLRLGQILNNLVSNAIKFTAQGEVEVQVRIESRPPGQIVLGFRVRDTGIGLTHEQIGKLFKSFSQADATTTRKFGGTGLGLAISSRLVELMDGTIWVESRFGQGSVFSFNLPFVWTGADSSVLPDKFGAPDTRDNHTELFGLHVLLVEDNEFDRQLASLQLKHVGIEVSIAHDGAEAVQAVQQQTFDAILMDMQMPNMGGLEATRAIRKDRAFAELPIIAMTANVMTENREQCLAVGMNDFVAKPTQPNVLYATLARCTQRDVQHVQLPATAILKPDQTADSGMLSRIPQHAIPAVQIDVLLEQLTTQLEAFHSGAGDSMRLINEQIQGTASAPHFARLHQYINNYDYENALLEVRHLVKDLI